MRMDNSPDAPKQGHWCVYVLRCRNNYLYIGLTNNLEKRLHQHGQGRGSKFVRAWRPFELMKTIPCKNASEARSLEYRLKRLKRDRKIEVLGLRIE
ncbi:MAG: GIY-YIG nuclease family protein [bacterium]